MIVIIGFFLLTKNSGSHTGSLFETELEVIDVDEINNDENRNLDKHDAEETTISPQGMVFVDVQGEVVNPGVFEVAHDVRIGYLIDLAGGLTDDANTRGLNQAARIHDEMVIFVPHVDDENTLVTELEENNEQTDQSDPSGLISLNEASALELQSLPGIGPTISANIIAYREENGIFSTIDELIHVAGIGARTLENIYELIKP